MEPYVHSIAIVTDALASVASVIFGVLTMCRRRANWRRACIRQFGFGLVAALSALSLVVHSPSLDLIVMATAIALFGLFIYTSDARRGSSPAK